MGLQFFVKVIVSALIIAFISELSKRHTFLGAIIVSWPIISILSIIWLYWDTRNVEMISTLSKDLFWLTMPGLAFFLFLPALLRAGVSFTFSTISSLLLTAGVYLIFMWVKCKFSA